MSFQIVVSPPSTERNTEPGSPHVDIAGFSIAYVAGGAVAWLYRRRSPRLAWTFLVGIAVFLLHLPLLPIAPRLVGAVMSASICLCIGLTWLLATLAASVAAPDASPR